MRKISLIVFLLFISNGYAQEKSIDLLEQGIKRFKTVQKPFIDSCKGLYTDEVLATRMFKTIDTIYLYDEITVSSDFINRLELDGKHIIRIDQNWLDSTNVHFYSLIENPFPVVEGLNCGILFRAKGCKAYSCCLYSDSKRTGEILFLSNGILKKTELCRIFLNDEGVFWSFDKRYIAFNYRVKSLDNSEIDLTYINRKNIFIRPILFIDVKNYHIKVKVNYFGKIKYYTVQDANRDYSKDELSKLKKHSPPKDLNHLW